MRVFGIIIRILVIVIPVLLSITFLFSPFEKIPLSKEKITENLTMVKVSEEEIFKPSLRTTLRDIFEVPFDLKWYEICFVNRNTSLIYENGEIDAKNINVSVNFNNQTELYIPYGETNCTTYKFEKDFTFIWHFAFPLNLSKLLDISKGNIIPLNETDYIREASASLHHDVEAYAKPELSGIIVKNILFLFAWCGLVFLFIQIYHFIKLGKRID